MATTLEEARDGLDARLTISRDLLTDLIAARRDDGGTDLGDAVTALTNAVIGLEAEVRTLQN